MMIHKVLRRVNDSFKINLLNYFTQPMNLSGFLIIRHDIKKNVNLFLLIRRKITRIYYNSLISVEFCKPVQQLRS